MHSESNMPLSTNQAQQWELVKYAQNGDQAAFTELVAYTNQLIHSIALSVTKDIGFSEDVSQQVFVKIWQNLPKLKKPESFLPWVRQMTRTTAINFLRDQGKIQQQMIEGEEVESILESLADPRLNQEEAFIRSQRNKLLNYMLDKLSHDDRDILILYFREEQGSADIGRLLDVSDGYVRKKIQRIKQQLKDNILRECATHLISSTSPVAVNAALISSIVALASVSPPATASVMTKVLGASLTTSATASWQSKLLFSVGFVFFGGLLVTYFNNLNARKVMGALENADEQQELIEQKNKANRNMIGAIAVMGIGYGFSQGWLIPVIGYGLFLWQMNKYTSYLFTLGVCHIKKTEEHASQARAILKQKIGCRIGWLMGFLGGTSGLLMGLFQSGRFMQPW